MNVWRDSARLERSSPTFLPSFPVLYLISVLPMIRQLRSLLHCMDGLCFSECIQFVEYVVKPSLYNVNFLDSARAPSSRVSGTSGSSRGHRHARCRSIHTPPSTTPKCRPPRRRGPSRFIDTRRTNRRRKLLVYNKPEFIGINEKLYSRVAQDRINAAASAAATSTAASICSSSSCRIVIKRRRRQNADHHRRLFSQLCQQLLKTRTALGGCEWQLSRTTEVAETLIIAGERQFMTSQSCLMTSQSCLMTSQSCLMTSQSCLMTSQSCLMTSQSCLMTSQSCLMTSQSCLMTSQSCFMTSQSCLMTSQSCLMTSQSCLMTSQIHNHVSWHHNHVSWHHNHVSWHHNHVSWHHNHVSRHHYHISYDITIFTQYFKYILCGIVINKWGLHLINPFN